MKYIILCLKTIEYINIFKGLQFLGRKEIRNKEKYFVFKLKKPNRPEGQLGFEKVFWLSSSPIRDGILSESRTLSHQR